MPQAPRLQPRKVSHLPSGPIDSYWMISSSMMTSWCFSTVPSQTFCFATGLPGHWLRSVDVRNRRFFRWEVACQDGRPVDEEAAIGDGRYVGIDFGDLGGEAVHADEDAFIMEPVDGSFQTFDSVGVAARVEEVMSRASAPRGRVDHDLAEACLVAVLDDLVDFVFGEAEEPVGAAGHVGVFGGDSIRCLVGRHAVRFSQLCHDGVELCCGDDKQRGCRAFQLRTGFVLGRRRKFRRLCTANRAAQRLPIRSSDGNDGLLVPRSIESRAYVFRQGDADPQERDSVGTGSGDASEVKGNPVVGPFDLVFELSVDAAESDDEPVAFSAGRVS